MTSIEWTQRPGTAPVRLRLRRTAGFDLQALSQATNGLPAVNVARPGRWGNPHVALRTWYHGPMPELGLGDFDAEAAADADREGARIAVALFRADWEQAMRGRNHGHARRELEQLRGKNLACWCEPGAPCHADVLLELANGPVRGEGPLYSHANAAMHMARAALKGQP